MTTIPEVMRETRRGRLPERYSPYLQGPFHVRMDTLLRPGIRILDVGAGSVPTVALDRRPADCHYVGIDVSREELDKAAPGAYDEVHVWDITEPNPELEGAFDLILSWNVIEHIRPLDVAMENLRTFLRPGGELLAQGSGGYSFFALLNRVVPHRLTQWLLARLIGRPAESVFPAYYDKCSYSALMRMSGGWSHWEVTPLFTAASTYFRFSHLAQAAYIWTEELIYRRDLRNLAAYYLIHGKA